MKRVARNAESSIFVSCAQSLEPLLMQELRELGFSKLRKGSLGVYLDNAKFSDVYRINYCSRLASRVLWPLLRFRCADRDALYGNIAALPWKEMIDAKATIAIDANLDSHPMLRNSHFAALVVKDAVCDKVRESRGSRPSVDKEDPTVQLNLYIERGWATLSWDTSGQPLHKRGYRQEGTVAPLQESLAAAMLIAGGYKGEGSFCDPMCGSGTLLVEAALMATKTPPGFLRHRWGFMGHPKFVQLEWLREKNRADEGRSLQVPFSFVGLESSAEAAASSRKNLRASGMSSLVEVIEVDCTTWSNDMRFQWIATNPPYGVRLEQSDTLMAQLKRFVDLHAEDKGCALVLSPVPMHDWETVGKFSNGGLAVGLYRM